MFAEALWSNIDSRTELPKDTLFYSFAFLNLPEPEPGISQEKFSTLLTFTRVASLAWKCAISSIFDSKNKKGITPSDNRYIKAWLNGTVRLVTDNEEENSKLIDWK